ncbi:response regulator [Marinicella sp. S1101]|uniref:sigma-54-dependent transcriptional regulator n=1 Tax=Marinicella marina TaxID=2996016 RepID=UPI002260E8FF|nr:response regulator [Marinicella marina]MCX7555171.1 response regulator [Marinicella marina]MDJ1139997.1 response regulator [Marinicella marina]
MSSEQKKILIVDDEPDILQLLEISLTRMQFKVYKAENLGSAKYQLSKTTFHLCLTDFKLPDGTGSELVDFVASHYPNTPIAVITAFGTINHAVETLKKGAYDFITKPISLETLRQLVITGLQHSNQEEDQGEAVKIGIPTDYFKGLDDAIGKYAQSKAPVIIYGKRGTWKEKFAQLIHKNSGLAQHEITLVDCHDADLNLTPEQAGTLVYKNVEKLRPEQQTTLINFVKALSDNQRIVVTTDWSEDEFKHSLGVKKSLLRVLCVGEIETQSIAELNDDLIEICKTRLEQLADKWNKLPCKIHPTAMAKLKGHEFSGNMRELDFVLSKAAVNCQNQLIREEDLQLENTGFKPQLSKEMNLEKYIEEIEIREITNALAKADNNKTKAAELLGISFRALRYKIKKLGID